MNSMMDIGFWLDLGGRISAALGNVFRWVFATKGRLQLVIIAVVVLASLWGCSRMELQKSNHAAAGSQATATATGVACFRPTSSTPAEAAAAALSVDVCTSPDFPSARRASTSRTLTITDKDNVNTTPDAALVEHFAFHVPNQVQQIGGADANGNTTVLAQSSASKFLLTFDKKNNLVKLQDITETKDATNAPAPSATSTDSATTNATATPSTSATTR